MNIFDTPGLNPHFGGKRYIEMYDNHGLRLLGSEYTLVFDQRLGNATAIDRLANHTRIQARAYLLDNSMVKPRQCYVKICRYDHVLVEACNLRNLCFEGTL